MTTVVYLITVCRLILPPGGGGVRDGRSVSLRPRDRFWGVAREIGGTEGPCSWTPSERGLEGPPPLGIVGQRTNSITETAQTIPTFLLSPSFLSTDVDHLALIPGRTPWQLFLDRGRRISREDEEYNADNGGGGVNSNDETEWFLCTCRHTTQLTCLVGSLVTFRDGGSTERIGSGGDASLRDRPSLAIGGWRAFPTRSKAAYSVVGEGGGEKGSWRK